MSDERDTKFNLHGYGVVWGSARGLSYRYKPLDNGKNHTDVWGGAWSSARAALKGLHMFTLSCKDVVPPGFASLNIGDAVVFDGLPWKQRASDAFAWPTAAGTTPLYTDAFERTVSADKAVWVEQCPTVTALVEDFDADYQDEWSQQIAWTLTLRAYRIPT